ncbi:MAG: hypothetical protein WC876_01525 [Candidatus Thermoplasmatota archaeon]|jgi:hypothetical protein
MNPLSKAISTVLVLAAGTLGTSLGDGLPFPNPFDGPASTDDGSATGNETGNNTTGDGGAGNGTADNSTAGNNTADGNSTAPDGNQTAQGNTTAGNETAGTGNETAEPAPAAEPPSAVCSFNVYESGYDLTPSHHEWEWLVTKDVQRLEVTFYSYGGVPVSLGGQPDVRLIDGSGRTLAHSASGDDMLHVALERGTDYLASGQWRLVFDSSDAFADYYAEVTLGCTA